MSVRDIELELYENLNSFFIGEGFELKKSLKQYRKTTASGFLNFIFSVSKSADDFFLEVNFGVRVEAIEHISQQFLDTLPAFQKETNTLIISIGKFNDNKYFRYRIANREDLKLTCKQVCQFTLEQGLDFLSKNQSLNSIDEVFNKKPHEPCKYLYNQTHRYFKGLVASKINHNPKFVQLSEIYHQKLQAMKVPETTLTSYSSLANYLTYYSAN